MGQKKKKENEASFEYGVVNSQKMMRFNKSGVCTWVSCTVSTLLNNLQLKRKSTKGKSNTKRKEME